MEKLRSGNRMATVTFRLKLNDFVSNREVERFFSEEGVVPLTVHKLAVSLQQVGRDEGI